MFNYVILGSEDEIYKYAFNDLNGLDNVIYVSGCKPSKCTLKGFLYRTHFRPELNEKIRIPGKSIWNHFYFKDTLSKNNKYCFIFLANFAMFAKQSGYHQYLRRKYPDCKIVLFLTDIFARQTELFTHEKWKIEKERALYDLIISYDKSDCQKYGFTYHHTVFSSNFILPDLNVEESDVYFVAKYKGRLQRVIELYDLLSSFGLRCDFYIYKCPSDMKVERPGISYIEKPISYAENLVRTIKTKFLLEIMQNNADGYTYRTWEAIAFKKKLITNNKSIIDAPFYNPKLIYVVNNYCDLKDGIAAFIQDNNTVDFNYTKEMSPVALLEFIDSKFR